MKNIWESCTFSDEIISGNLDVSKFAVEELKAPTGKFRIISIDKWEPLGEGHAIFGDYDTLEEALTEARKNSHTRPLGYQIPYRYELITRL